MPIGRKPGPCSETFFARRGFTTDAETEFKAALRLSPQYAPAAINLADLYRLRGRNEDGQIVLRAAISASPYDASLHYALGLALARLKRSEEAVSELRRATELDPDRSRYAYVYAVALHSAGRPDEAISMLRQSLVRHPDDRDALLALVSFSREKGDLTSALESVERLARSAPTNRDLTNLVETLRREMKKPDVR
jgi:Flp pilus assembly protein TadD